VRETALQTPRSVKKGRGRKCSRHRSRGAPAARDEDHGEAGCPPAAHGGPWWSRSPPAVCGGPHAGAGACLKEALTPWRARAEAGFWQDLWREEPTLEQVCWQDL